MPDSLHPDDFLQRVRENGLAVLDVRSPAEYQHGHIPGAVSLPLFTDDERAQVGIRYKQNGNRPAVLKGLELIGPKLAELARAGLKHANAQGQVAVHCWRGGQRSASVAWLLEQVGLHVTTLRGGYKAYRNRVLQEFARAWNLVVLGGPTGSAKTDGLREWARQGHPVLNLEALAHHKGSAFGALGEAPPPTQEGFENRLFDALQLLNPDELLWVEDESRYIGALIIPLVFWRQMEQAPVLFLETPRAVRVPYLVQQYGGFPTEALAASLNSIRKRLGGERTEQALQALHAGQLAQVAELTLAYYDKAYYYQLEHRIQEGRSRLWRVLCPTTHAPDITNVMAFYLERLHPVWQPKNP
jgi:tRNA 2-selenouridine synthase